MLRGRRLRNHERTVSEEGERDLARSGIVGRRDLGEYPSSRRALVGEVPMPERAVGDDRRAVPFAPWDDLVLDRAFLEIVEDLVACDPARTGDVESIIEIRNVEIAYTPRRGSCPNGRAARSRRKFRAAESGRASAAGSNPAGRS